MALLYLFRDKARNGPKIAIFHTLALDAKFQNNITTTKQGWKMSRYFRKYQNIENITKYHDIFDIFQKMKISSKLCNNGWALCIRRTRTQMRVMLHVLRFNVAGVSCNVAGVFCNVTGNTCNITCVGLRRRPRPPNTQSPMDVTR